MLLGFGNSWRSREEDSPCELGLWWKRRSHSSLYSAKVENVTDGHLLRAGLLSATIKKCNSSMDSFPCSWPSGAWQVTASYVSAGSMFIWAEGEPRHLCRIWSGSALFWNVCFSLGRNQGTSDLAFVCFAAFGFLKHACSHGAAVQHCETYSCQTSLYYFIPCGN